MIDYIGLLIGVIVVVASLACKLFYARKYKDINFIYDEVMINQDEQSQNDLVASKKEIFDRLMTLEPFDYEGEDEVVVGPLLCEPDQELAITGLSSARFRDVMKPKFHGLQGRVKVRQVSRLIQQTDGISFKFGSYSEWEEVGPVKKGL